MPAKSFFLSVPLMLISFLGANANAVIIEGKFTGTVMGAYECVNLRADTIGECSFLWEENPEGSIASGSFWYDTDIAPPDASSMETYGSYFTYTNEWVNMFIDIGGKRFDISDSSTINDEMWDVEHVSVVDRNRERDGFELQSLTITDKTSSGSFTGNFITKSLTLNLTTWENPIVKGTSLIQEYTWQENGNQLQGIVYFDYESFMDGDVKFVNSSIKLTDFSMNIRRESVPEPSPLVLFLMAMFGLGTHRFLNRTCNLISMNPAEPQPPQPTPKPRNILLAVGIANRASQRGFFKLSTVIVERFFCHG
jgi:hypothetical protein